MYYNDLVKQVRYYKETEERVDTMCKIMEDFKEDIIEEEKKETVIRMIHGNKL